MTTASAAIDFSAIEPPVCPSCEHNDHAGCSNPIEVRPEVTVVDAVVRCCCGGHDDEHPDDVEPFEWCSLCQSVAHATWYCPHEQD